MKVKLFAYIRDKDYVGAKIIDYPYQEDIYSLCHSMCDKYGNKLRAKMLSPDGEDLGEEIIIMVNGRRVEHINGIHTKLKSDDTVQIFPVVAGG